jgi:hypothetical protein
MGSIPSRSLGFLRLEVGRLGGQHWQTGTDDIVADIGGTVLGYTVIGRSRQDSGSTEGSCKD